MYNRAVLWGDAYLNLSFARDALPYLLIGGIGIYFSIFARRYRDRSIERLRRPSSLLFYRALGALGVLLALTGLWMFIRDSNQHEIILEIIWFAGWMVFGLFGLLRAKWYRDWELRRLESRSQIPALRVIGGFFLAVAIVGLWALVHDGVSLWR